MSLIRGVLRGISFMRYVDIVGVDTVRSPLHMRDNKSASTPGIQVAENLADTYFRGRGGGGAGPLGGLWATAWDIML